MQNKKYVPMLVAICLSASAGFTAHAFIDVMLSSQTVYINGEKADIEAYNIDGSNYFKLRDLGDNLGFTVDYDEGSNSIMVNNEELQSSNLEQETSCFVAPDGTKYYPGDIYIDEYDMRYLVDKDGDLISKGGVPDTPGQVPAPSNN